jgi:hypothetical protein
MKIIKRFLHHPKTEESDRSTVELFISLLFLLEPQVRFTFTFPQLMTRFMQFKILIIIMNVFVFSTFCVCFKIFTTTAAVKNKSVENV